MTWTMQLCSDGVYSDVKLCITYKANLQSGKAIESRKLDITLSCTKLSTWALFSTVLSTLFSTAAICAWYSKNRNTKHQMRVGNYVKLQACFTNSLQNLTRNELKLPHRTWKVQNYCNLQINNLHITRLHDRYDASVYQKSVEKHNSSLACMSLNYPSAKKPPYIDVL